MDAMWAGVVGALVVAAPAAWTRLASRGRVFGADDIAAVPGAPVALVLGAGVGPDGRPSAFLRGRLDVARDLYRAGRVDVLLVSGDNRTPDYDEPTAMRDYLLSQGVPAHHIVADRAGNDSYDSCARARRVFGVTRLLVVSQTYHLPRALAICRALGLDADGVGDHSVRRHARVWRAGVLREFPANVKAVADVVTRRDPVLGPRDSSVDDALRSR